jgi:hypothetical protein
MALPFERLRSLARHSGDTPSLIVETAACLVDFSADPAQLVTVCRRLLAHHPSCGPLWWLCARVIVADDPAAAARDARHQFEGDGTAARLASHLPFPHDQPIAVAGWSEIASDALMDRPDLDIVIVRLRGAQRSSRPRSATGAALRAVDATEVLALEPSHVLVETVAASPDRALVPAGVEDLLDLLPGTAVWMVAGVGRVLPPRLFDVLHAEAEHQGAGFDTIATSTAVQIVGPNGLDPPGRLSARIDCPVAPELLRL